MTAVTSLIVQTKTSNIAGANTDDWVYFNIGPREWLLDNKNRNDFERGRTDTFVLRNLSGLKTSDIRRIQLRKTGTDGWFPDWIKVWVNQPSRTGKPFYHNNVKRWLDGGKGAELKYGLLWEAGNFPCRFPGPSSVPTDRVSSLIVSVQTHSASNAGTDDYVYFTIGTREWLLDNLSKNDFEPGHTDFFTLGELTNLNISDLRELGLRKTGTNAWKPVRLRVFVNTPATGTPFYDGTIDLTLNKGSDSRNRFGPRYVCRDYPQPQPNYSQLDSQPNINPNPRITSLQLVIKTKNSTDAQTDDRVFFNIGTREWLLDNPNRNDFEQGATDTFVLSGFQRDFRFSDFRKIGLRKEGKNGWRPEWIKVFVNDPQRRNTPFYEGRIDVMLDGEDGAQLANGLSWEATDFFYDIPVQCHFVIGQTNPSIRPQRPKEASAELLRNLNTASYRHRANSSNAIWTIGRLRFFVTGFNDVRIPDADAQLLPDRTNADFVKIRAIQSANNRRDRLNIYFVRNTATGSNWMVPAGATPACWVRDVRSGTPNTTGNFKAVVSSCSHEIGHFFGLPHICQGAGCSPSQQKFLMFGAGTNATSQLVSKSEIATVRSNAVRLSDWDRNVC